MKIRVICCLILALPLIAAAQPTTQADANDSRQKALDETSAQLNDTISRMKSTLGKIQALDSSDAELKKSDQAQIDTSHMIDKALHKIETEDGPRVIERGRQFDIKRQQHINSGCPAEGGTGTPAQAARCNPETERLNAESDQIMADAETVFKNKMQYEKLREKVTATTLANAAQEKANNAQREELMAQKAQLEAAKKKLEAQLLDIRAGVDSCAKLLRQRGATCESIEAKCGLMFDGGDPDLPASIYDSPCDKLPPVRPRTTAATVNPKK